jgi:hypothetical protein|tara:strand:+ start:2021 stop:2335 length:315 start_codon:yes stop_codon:yes gene_type:complete
MDTSAIPPEPRRAKSERVENRDVLEKAIQRLDLCRYAVQEAHYDIQYPGDPESKADLLIAVEDLTYEVLDLLRTAKSFAWGPDSDEVDRERRRAEEDAEGAGDY